MDPQALPHLSPSAGRCCSCACCCSSSSTSPSTSSWCRSVKRKVDQADGGDAAMFLGVDAGDIAARVEVENEVAALREAMASQQQTIQELCADLEEERNASASAASEAMSMILRLQREKAEVQMDARQFKRFAEEKMVHDQDELNALEDLVFKREEAVQSLSFQLQAYRHRLLSHGIDPDAVFDGELNKPVTPVTPQFDYVPAYDDVQNCVPETPMTPKFEDIPAYDYPPLICKIPDHDDEEEGADLEKYAFGETPLTEKELEYMEQRSCHLETITPSDSTEMKKGVLSCSPERATHFRQLSLDSNSIGKEGNGTEFKRGAEFPIAVDLPLDDGAGGDDMSERVYPIDAVHRVPTAVVLEDWKDATKEKERIEEFRGEDEEGGSVDINKLYLRLQALEADRESMRQAIISMRTEKAQLVLLREMAQQLREVSPERAIVKKKSWIETLCFVIVVKWIESFVLWRKKASRSKYAFGLSKGNVGLLQLLDKSPQMSNWRCLPKTQV